MEEFLRKFQVPQLVGEQAREYHRLAEVKCSAAIRGLSSTALALICIELACTQLREPIDKRQTQKLSGLQHKAYLTAYQTVEKLLSVTSRVTLRELAVRFGYLEAEQLAEEVLQSYKKRMEVKYTAAQKETLDFDRPLYPTAALYAACKLLKIRCDKTKFFSAASCARSMFQNVLDEMNKCAPKDIDEFKSKQRKAGKSHKEVSAPEGLDQEADVEAGASGGTHPEAKKARREPLECRILSNPLCQEYLAWKEKIITEARAKLEA